MLFLFGHLVARRALDARFGNIDFDRIPGQGIGVEHADGLICVSLCGHGDKGKALGHAARPVLDQINRGYFPGLREQGLDVSLSS